MNIDDHPCIEYTRVVCYSFSRVY